jgi:hypothetical protein
MAFRKVAVAQLIEALLYELECRGFDSPWYHWEFFINIIISTAL